MQGWQGYIVPCCKIPWNTQCLISPARPYNKGIGI